MRILIATEVGSIHAARWVNQLRDSGWDVDVFQVSFPGSRVHPVFQFGRIFNPGFNSTGNLEYVNTLPISGRFLRILSRFRISRYLLLFLHRRFLVKRIKSGGYDVIHSHGLNIDWVNLLIPVQSALKKLGRSCSSSWLYSTWGSDLDFYPTLSPGIRDGVKSVVSECDFLTTECLRDKRLAAEFGFRGEFLGFFPDFGGVPAEFIRTYSTGKRPSERNVILVKGRDASSEDPVGRAMTILKAFHACSDRLQKFTIAIFQASKSIVEEASILKVVKGLNIVILPYVAYSDLMRIMASARIFISMTINDGLPSSLVEAMALGAFPVYSDIESIQDFVQSGRTGFLNNPEDSMELAKKIDRALTDDQLVDLAAQENFDLIQKALSEEVVLPRVLEMYRKAAEKRPRIRHTKR